ncbi:hypothetical protein SPRG_08946 [Saprolegnia parasitica CBS 223.65]|uniref:Tetraspanin n=1 Tax=Saprolegnia parasitica (strain CBS 223.65) TaxID=695850 RepID=A0A067CFS4_SAPPC|nr:hypothetical protein SPRG_08946 [Saprolegnia parasitica CBS 223.65]KDO25647.1 hypothetical protein SPRG_08946 [Saprolegnia parasitica CBS 223.65]|eukprot:XP_012203678.1 hypothetical protein SPRG_08946 [Saprolegnia parasitica CBS 223.65]
MQCRSFSRLVLIFTNVLFLVLGGVLIVIGGYMMHVPDLNAFSADGISSAVMACGVLIVLIALLGCCGAHWESKVFLCPYATLVTVSVVAQLALAGLMLHVHHSLVHISQASYANQSALLSEDDQIILGSLHSIFNEAYDACQPQVDLIKSLQVGSVVLQCMGADPSYQWFAPFAANRCSIRKQDLLPNSTFRQCAKDMADGASATQLTKEALFCSCEANLVAWMDEQSELIGTIVGVIAGFEVALVLLSFYLVCTQRRRHRGYQEIRMPLRPQFNAHPYNNLRMNPANNPYQPQAGRTAQSPLVPPQP